MPPKTMTQQGGGSAVADPTAQMSAAVSDDRVVDLPAPIKRGGKPATVPGARGVPLSLRARCR